MTRVLPILVALSGCVQHRSAAPEAPLQLARADYTVVGRVTHEECGVYLFALDVGHLFSNERHRIPGILRVSNREEERALYHALQQLPDATHLVAHRSRTTAQGMVIGTLPVFGERCVEVNAVGIRIGDRPVLHEITGPPGPVQGAVDEPSDDPPAVAPAAPMR